jgi:dTDP-4-dehydrorhamnose reductase
VKRALLTGGSGQLGSALIAAADAHRYSLYAPTRRELDLTDPASIRLAVDSDEWAVVLSCGAYTDVDKAESDADVTDTINHIAPGLLAAAAAKRSIPIVHVSTDYVFDGSKTTPYTETDPVNPIGVYGRTKEAGEAAVRACNARYAVVRTAWVVSAGGKNFVKTMLRLAQERMAVSVVDDQRGCPTSAKDLAAGIFAIADRMISAVPPLAGTWHFANAGHASWYELADFIFDYLERAGLKRPVLKAISSNEYPTPAKRPANSRLDTSQFRQDFGMSPRAWQDAIQDILNEITIKDMEAKS